MLGSSHLSPRTLWPWTRSFKGRQFIRTISQAKGFFAPPEHLTDSRPSGAPGVAPDLMSSFAVTLTDSRPALDFEKLTSILFVFAAAQRLDEDRRFDVRFFLV